MVVVFLFGCCCLGVGVDVGDGVFVYMVVGGVEVGGVDVGVVV